MLGDLVTLTTRHLKRGNKIRLNGLGILQVRKRAASLAEASEIGDWEMPDFRAACVYAAAQGWLIVGDDVLTLTTAGLAAA